MIDFSQNDNMTFNFRCSKFGWEIKSEYSLDFIWDGLITNLQS